MNSIYEKLTTCLASVREKTDFVPETAIVLGSGLGDYAEQIKIETTIDYKDIKGFPTSTVPGHKGRFVFGYVDSVPVVIMQGRVHYYEGYPITDVVLPTRLMGMMGAKKLYSQMRQAASILILIRGLYADFGSYCDSHTKSIDRSQY